MLAKIFASLSFRTKPVVRLERHEPVLKSSDHDESLEIQMQREFGHLQPAPSLNPAYLQGMTQASNS